LHFLPKQRFAFLAKAAFGKTHASNVARPELTFDPAGNSFAAKNLRDEPKSTHPSASYFAKSDPITATGGCPALVGPIVSEQDKSAVRLCHHVTGMLMKTFDIPMMRENLRGRQKPAALSGSIHH
jgi:hypothetical protein